jgi:hypothetical protein
MKKSKLRIILTISFLAVFLIGIFIYILFQRPSLSPIDVALGLRNTVMSLAVDDEHTTDDFESLVFAKNLYSYNTCEDNVKVHFTKAWARDWLYIAIGDVLYSEISKEDSQKESLTQMIEDLYENNKVGTLLDAYTFHGQESYCLPYLLLDDLKGNSEDFAYSESYDLAERLCKDFYYTGDEMWYTAEPIDSLCKYGENCLDDETFYNTLDILLNQPVETMPTFEFGLVTQEDRWLRPVDVMSDNYVVAYESSSDDYVSWTNHQIIIGLYSMMYYDYEIRSLETTQNVCDFAPAYHLGLMKALSVKGKYLQDSALIERNQRILDSLIKYCFSSDTDFQDALFSDFEFSQQIELYYLFEDRFEGFDINKYVNKFLSSNSTFRPYEGSKYLFLDVKSTNVDVDECVDVDIDFGRNAKTYFYLLMHSIYGK